MCEKSTTRRRFLCSYMRASDLQRPARGVPSDRIMGRLCQEENGRYVCEITSILPRVCSPPAVFNDALANCTFRQSGGPVIAPLHGLMGWFHLSESSSSTECFHSGGRVFFSTNTYLCKRPSGTHAGPREEQRCVGRHSNFLLLDAC